MSLQITKEPNGSSEQISSSRIEKMANHQKATASRNQEMHPGTSKKLLEENYQKPIYKLPRGKTDDLKLPDLKKELIAMEGAMNTLLYNEPVMIEQMQICLAQILDLTAQLPMGDDDDLFNEWSDKSVELATKLAVVTSTGRPLEPPSNEPPTKEAIRSKLEIAFARLTPCTSLVEFRAVALLTAKALAIFRHYSPDDQLESDLVDFAMARLSNKSRRKFSQHQQLRKGNLQEMVTFMCIEMGERRNYELHKLPSKNDLHQAQSSSDPFCIYCHTNGHLVRHCDRLNMQICFKCFKNGHQLTGCQNQEPSLADLLKSI